MQSLYVQRIGLSRELMTKWSTYTTTAQKKRLRNLKHTQTISGHWMCILAFHTCYHRLMTSSSSSGTGRKAGNALRLSRDMIIMLCKQYLIRKRPTHLLARLLMLKQWYGLLDLLIQSMCWRAIPKELILLNSLLPEINHLSSQALMILLLRYVNHSTTISAK